MNKTRITKENSGEYVLSICIGRYYIFYTAQEALDYCHSIGITEIHWSI